MPRFKCAITKPIAVDEEKEYGYAFCCGLCDVQSGGQEGGEAHCDAGTSAATASCLSSIIGGEGKRQPSLCRLIYKEKIVVSISLTTIYANFEGCFDDHFEVILKPLCGERGL